MRAVLLPVILTLCLAKDDAMKGEHVTDSAKHNVTLGSNKTASSMENKTAVWSAEAHAEAGFMLMENDNVEDAAVRFLRAIEVAPSHGMSYFGLGTAIYHLNNPTTAAEHLHYATLTMPSHAESYFHLGVALQEADDDGELGELALQQLWHATELSPKYALAYSYLGTALHAQNHSDNAISALEQALELDPTIHSAHQNTGMIILDEISSMNQTTEEVELLRDSAAVHFEEALTTH